MKSRLIRKKELLEVTGLSASTIWRLEKAGNFPRRCKIGNYSVAWIEKEVSDWINNLAKSKGA